MLTPPLHQPHHDHSDGLDGGFTVLRFDVNGARQVGPIVYVQIPNDAVYKTDQDQVAAYAESADLIVSAALPQAESLRAIDARLA